MLVSVLGNATRYLAPFSGGSGYLVTADGTRVLLDCGAGVGSAYAALGAGELDALVLSHFHHDHASDFLVLRDALTPRTRLFLPPGERARLDAMAQAFAFRGPMDLPCAVVEPEPGAAFDVGPLRLSFAPTAHSAPGIATRIERAGRSFVYAGDTSPCEGLLRLAGGCDVLLMHTLLPTVNPGSGHAQRHSTAATAAAFAAAAGAGRLVLSHRFWKSADKDMLEAARAHPDVVLAREGMRFEV